MTKDACEAILTFWRNREQAGAEPFLFSRVQGRDDGGAECLIPSQYPLRSLAPTRGQKSSQTTPPQLEGWQYIKTTTFVPGLSSSDEATTSDDSAPTAIVHQHYQQPSHAIHESPVVDSPVRYLRSSVVPTEDLRPKRDRKPRKDIYLQFESKEEQRIISKKRKRV